MQKATLVLLLAAAGVLHACASAFTPQSTPTPQASAMQRLCLEGVRRAIDLEIARYREWLQESHDPEQQAAYRRALDYLEKARQRYQSLAPAAFRLNAAWHYIPGVTTGAYGRAALPAPSPITLDDAWVEGPLPGLLYYAGQSRSGPFYTVVAVQGGLEQMRPGVHYRVTLQPIMPVSYPFSSFYVCVTGLEEKP